MNNTVSDKEVIPLSRTIQSIIMYVLTGTEGLVIVVTFFMCYYQVFTEGVRDIDIFKAGYLTMGAIIVYFLMITTCMEFGQRSMNQILFFLLLASSNFDLIGAIFIFMKKGTIVSLYTGAIIVLLATPFTVLVFWFYQRNLCRGNGYQKTKADFWIVLGGILDLALIIFGTISGQLFYFDETNQYTEEWLMVLTYIYPIGTFIFCVVQNFSCQLSKRKHATLCLFALMPLLLAIISLLTQDSLYSHSAFVVGVLIVYVGVQVDGKLDMYVQNEKYHMQKQMLEEDALTHLLSRYAYSRDVVDNVEAQNPAEDTVVLAMDINGLKEANDTKGHEAGDEIIIGAGDCIRKALSKYGRCYRTGGDEFVAVLNISSDRIERVETELRSIVSQWHGKQLDELSISVGIATANENPGMDISQLIHVADQKMYDDKERYYAMTGKNRRRHS